MRITRIEVQGLFGIFHHIVPLNVIERITIIHGPNGVGKTALFRLLKSLFSGSYQDLHNIPYKVFEVYFDDNSYIKMTKVSIDENNQYSFSDDNFQELHDLSVAYQSGDSEANTFVIRKGEKRFNSTALRRIIVQMVPGLTLVGPNHYRYNHTGELLTLEKVLERFQKYIPEGLKTNNVEPLAYQHLRKSAEVHIIDTQRLIDLVPSDNTEQRGLRVPEAVSKYSKELVRQLQFELGQYAALSQSLDRTFPERLIGSVSTPHPISEDLGQKLFELEEKRATLMETGLLDKESAIVSKVPRNLDESTKRVLEIYVADVEKKLSVFDTIAAKIDVFKSIINQRFLYKNIRISRDEGIRFVSSSGDTKLLSPNQLSSGEQHELVLFYELLFEIKAGSLILIDEPEISLHVAWQVEFLKDLREVTKLVSLDILIATHSPQIINDRWDLTVELKGPKP